jgi:hypothetical protein
MGRRCSGEIIEFHPGPEQYAFTFGGVPAIRKDPSGQTMLSAGALRGTGDLPSTKLTMPFVNRVRAENLVRPGGGCRGRSLPCSGFPAGPRLVLPRRSCLLRHDGRLCCSGWFI